MQRWQIIFTIQMRYYKYNNMSWQTNRQPNDILNNYLNNIQPRYYIRYNKLQYSQILGTQNCISTPKFLFVDWTVKNWFTPFKMNIYKSSIYNKNFTLIGPNLLYQSSSFFYLEHKIDKLVHSRYFFFFFPLMKMSAPSLTQRYRIKRQGNIC